MGRGARVPEAGSCLPPWGPPEAAQAVCLARGVGLPPAYPGNPSRSPCQPRQAAPAPPLRPGDRHWAGRRPGPKTGLLGTPSHPCVFPSCRAHLLCTLSSGDLSPRPRRPLQGPQSGSTVRRPTVPSPLSPPAWSGRHGHVELLPPSASFPLAAGRPPIYPARPHAQLASRSSRHPRGPPQPAVRSEGQGGAGAALPRRPGLPHSSPPGLQPGPP